MKISSWLGERACRCGVVGMGAERHRGACLRRIRSTTQAWLANSVGAGGMVPRCLRDRNKLSCRAVVIFGSHQTNRSAPPCVKRTNVPLSSSSSQPRSIAKSRPALYSADVRCEDQQVRKVPVADIEHTN